VADCEDCGGRGWTVEVDGGAGTAKRCWCQAQDIGAQLRRAGTWPIYAHCTREAWRGTWPTQLSRWLTESWTCAILSPTTGAGKTHLATALLAEELRAGRAGRWWDTSELCERLKRAIGGGDQHALLAELKRPPTLVLDDLGAQHESDWTDSLLSHVFRFRMGHRYPTVFTTQAGDLVTLDALEPRLSSRLAAEVVVTLPGRDRRLEAAHLVR
jgi:chromosomal replication initiation ATPase DnaA